MAETRGRGQIISKGKDKWLVRIFKGRDPHGKKIYFNKVVDGKKSVAQKFLTAKLREKDIGVFIETSRQTLKELLDLWLKTVKTRVAEQTYNSYEMQARVHICPRIGHKRLSEIKIHDVQKVYTEMEAAGLSPRTIRYTHAVLAMAMKKAVELDYIIKNPCDFVELPKLEKDETKAMSPQQATSFLASATNDKFGLVFEFALVTGMRPEEYLSIRWSDIDFSRCSVTVQRALVWKKGGGFTSGPTKAKKSRRSLPLPATLVAKLKKHRKGQLEHRLELGAAYENLDLVFA